MLALDFYPKAGHGWSIQIRCLVAWKGRVGSLGGSLGLSRQRELSYDEDGLFYFTDLFNSFSSEKLYAQNKQICD